MKHRAEYLLPGALFPEATSRELISRSVEEAVAMAPDGAYCFTLYDTAEPVDLGPEYKVMATPQNRSGRYYLGGTVYNEIEVAALEEPTLLANMKGNQWDRLIKCRTGNWQPFTDEDELVAA